MPSVAGDQPSDQHRTGRHEDHEAGDTLDALPHRQQVGPVGHEQDGWFRPRGTEQVERGLQHQGRAVDRDGQYARSQAPQPSRGVGQQRVHGQGGGQCLSDGPDGDEGRDRDVDRTRGEPDQPADAQQRPHSVGRPANPRQDPGRGVDASHEGYQHQQPERGTGAVGGEQCDLARGDGSDRHREQKQGRRQLVRTPRSTTAGRLHPPRVAEDRESGHGPRSMTAGHGPRSMVAPFA